MLKDVFPLKSKLIIIKWDEVSDQLLLLLYILKIRNAARRKRCLRRAALLKKIQLFFGTGTILLNIPKNSATFTVQSIKDCTNIIIPHFHTGGVVPTLLAK